MADPDWIGNPARAPGFTDDGESVIYNQKRSSEFVSDFFQADLNTGEIEKLTTPGEQFVERISARRDNRALIRKQGNLFLVNDKTGDRSQLTGSAAADSSAHFMADGQRVMFTREGQQFAVGINGGLVSQLTDIRPG